jgi:hypothetical protein
MPEKHCHSSSISLTGMAVANRVFAGAALLALGEGGQFCLRTVTTFLPWAADCN